MGSVMLSSDSKNLTIEPSSPLYRVIVVDDSAIIRGIITRELESNPCFKVVATAANGELAISSLQRQPADVVILDIEMPVMDGLAAIPKLKEIDSGVQIIMASTLTQKNAEISLRALSLGAADYIPKPSTDQISAGVDFKRELVEKVKAFGALARRRGVRRPQGESSAPRTNNTVSSNTQAAKFITRPMPTTKPDIIAIGSSTGGPQALLEVIKAMGNGLSQPILITQHMPPSFTSILAEHITRQCGVTCDEAKDGQIIKSGHYYVAPGDYHMLIQRSSAGSTIKLSKDPAENYCRPAVDPMLRSIIAVYGKSVLTVILTGMGSDGCKGCQGVVNAGGTVIAQDELTSVVWGMPGAVVNAGLCSAILPLNSIGSTVRQMATKVGL